MKFRDTASIFIGLVMLVGALGVWGGGRTGSATAADVHDVSDTFPHYPDRERIARVEISDDQLQFNGQDAYATAHIAFAEVPMAIAAHYGVSIGDGWVLRDGTQTEYIAYRLLTKGDRIAILTLVPGQVVAAFPNVVDGVDLGPFADEVGELEEGETFIVSRLATCNEADIDACVVRAVNSYRPDTVPPIPVES